VILFNPDTDLEYGRFSDGKGPADFSPNSSLFYMTGDTQLHIMDTKSGAERGHLDDANGNATFSPDSTLLAAAVDDNTVHILDAKTGVELRVLTGHTKPINDLAFSSDGQLLLTSSTDGTVRLWKVDYHSLVTQACQRLTRDLTDAERRKFDITDT